ncbi:MAG: TetR/AcrR family transcriptional regulator [Spirochaetota bacterium]
MVPRHEEGSRDKTRTKRRLVRATLELLEDRGFESLGINAIAARAGVSKVLIYRYFGGLSGLLRALADELDPLQVRAVGELLESSSGEAPAGELVEEVVVGLHRALERDRLTKQLLIWELSRKNAVTRALAEAREEVGLEVSRRFTELLRSRRVDHDLDVNALLAIVTAGVSYLTLRADTVDVYNGVEIGTEAGWRRIGAALGYLVDSVTGRA